MLQTWHTLRQIDDAQAAKNQAAGARPTGLDQIIQTAKDAGAAVANGVVGIGRTLGIAAVVGQEWNDPRAWMQGLPMSRAALDSAVTGLTSMGASTNQYLAGKLPEGRAVKDQLDEMRKPIEQSEFDGSAGKFHDWNDWFKSQEATLRKKLPAYFASARPLGDGKPTADDASTANQRGGLMQPENKQLIKIFAQTHDPAVCKQLEANLMATPETLAVQQMRKDVLQSVGAQKFDQMFGAGSAENLLTTFHPIKMALTAAPLARGLGAAGAVVNAAEGGTVKGIIGNAVRSIPGAAGLGAVQQIEADPQSSAGEIVKSGLKAAATNTVIEGAAGALGAAARLPGRPAAVGEVEFVPEPFINAKEISPSPKRIYSQVDNFNKIADDGRLWGQTEGSVYGMDTPNASRLRTMMDPKVADPGTIIFEGEAADLFKRHPIEGPYSGMKRAMGQHKAGFGDLVWDEADTVRDGNTLIVRKATLDPDHAGQPNADAAKRLRDRQIFENAIPIVGGALIGGMNRYANQPAALPPVPPDEVQKQQNEMRRRQDEKSKQQ